MRTNQLQQNNNQLRQAQQNGEQVNQQNKQQQQKKQEKKKRPTISLKPQSFQSGKGLKKLYQLTNSISWQDSMTTQSAMNLVVLTLKSWQNQFLHKYYHELFFQRCQALGSNKLVTAYMNKVRRIHKGLDKWDEQKVQNVNPNLQGNQNNTDNKSVRSKNRNNRNASDNQGQGLNIGNQGEFVNYDDDIDEFEKFKERAQLAKKLGNVSVKSNDNKNHTDQQQIDEMMDQDLRLFEEMQRKKNNKNSKQKQNQDDGVQLGGESGVKLDDFDYDYD